jgi:NAD(P)-dependent dehydrogenase (short-subunit alcohol dehydrogenase family)
MDHGLFDLSCKVAVVTGAARGLGRAAAVGLARHGADVAVIDLDRERCDSTVNEITALGRRAVGYGCDVADEGAVRTTVGQIHQDFGRVDILVNIAGITARIASQQIPPETVRRLMAVNYCGTADGRWARANNSVATGNATPAENVPAKTRWSSKWPTPG